MGTQLTHFNWNQQFATYSIDVPKFKNKGGCDFYTFPIHDKNEIKEYPVVKINDLNKYLEEYKYLLINMSLESAAPNENWNKDIHDLYFLLGKSVKPHICEDYDESKIIFGKNDYIVGFLALEKKDNGKMLRYSWLHPFLRNKSIMRSLISFILVDHPIIVDPPVSKNMTYCLQSSFHRWMNSIFLCFENPIYKEGLTESEKKDLIKQVDFYIEFSNNKDNKQTETIKLLNLIKSYCTDIIDMKTAVNLAREIAGTNG